MKIQLKNGTELHPIMVTGGSSYVQGANRDTLSFVFPATEDMAALDAAFSAAACESITIISDNGSVSPPHKCYTIRAKLGKELVEVSPATAETDAIYEERIIVSMAQRTYTETQLTTLGDALAQTDETAIALYEAQAEQEEINMAQDEALIEIYEMIGG